MRTQSVVLCLVGLVLLFASSSNAEMRKWTRNGEKIEAEFVNRDGKTVTLRGTDGKEFTVKMHALSEEDRNYVKQHATPDKSDSKNKTANAEMRKWTNKKGKEFQAEFVKMERDSDGHNIVTLRKSDGAEMTVRMGNLSEEDRNYVKQLSPTHPDHQSKQGDSSAKKKPAGDAQSSASMRKWTRGNGKEFEAEFVKRDGPVVTLKKLDGTEMTVRMPNLSDDDRKYVRQLTRAKPAGKSEAPEAPMDTSVSKMPNQPPADSSQQRDWLRTHILEDAQLVGTFDSDAIAKISTTLQSVPDDQVALLAQYYYLTRSKTEQDAHIYSLQQQGYTEAQVDEAKAPVADLLTEMQNQGDACYSQIQTLGEPVQYLAQIEYASLPGWCASARCYVPDSYYDNGSFVGPYWNAGYCGVYAASVYHAYYDTGSRFYKTYHGVGDGVYRRHTAQMAQRSARYFHEHDFHRALAHDRLLKPSSPLRHAGRDAHVSERGKTAGHAERGKTAGHAEHGKTAEHVEHGKGVAKTERNKSGTELAMANKKNATSDSKRQSKSGATKNAKQPKHQTRKVKDKKQTPANKAPKPSASKAPKPSASKAPKPSTSKAPKPSASKAPKPSQKPAQQPTKKPSTAQHKH